MTTFRPDTDKTGVTDDRRIEAASPDRIPEPTRTATIAFNRWSDGAFAATHRTRRAGS